MRTKKNIKIINAGLINAGYIVVAYIVSLCNDIYVRFTTRVI